MVREVCQALPPIRRSRPKIQPTGDSKATDSSAVVPRSSAGIFQAKGAQQRTPSDCPPSKTVAQFALVSRQRSSVKEA